MKKTFGLIILLGCLLVGSISFAASPKGPDFSIANIKLAGKYTTPKQGDKYISFAFTIRNMGAPINLYKDRYLRLVCVDSQKNLVLETIMEGNYLPGKPIVYENVTNNDTYRIPAIKRLELHCNVSLEGASATPEKNLSNNKALVRVYLDQSQMIKRR